MPVGAFEVDDDAAAAERFVLELVVAGVAETEGLGDALALLLSAAIWAWTFARAASSWAWMLPGALAAGVGAAAGRADGAARAATDAGAASRLVVLATGANLDVAEGVAEAGGGAGLAPPAMVPFCCMALISACALALAAATCAWILLSRPFWAAAAGAGGLAADGTPTRWMAGRAASGRARLGGVPFCVLSGALSSSSSLPNTFRIGRFGGMV